MVNRMVLVFANLKPGKLRGVLSEGMVLAASNAEHTKVELLEPPTGTFQKHKAFLLTIFFCRNQNWRTSSLGG